MRLRDLIGHHSDFSSMWVKLTCCQILRATSGDVPSIPIHLPSRHEYLMKKAWALEYVGQERQRRGGPRNNIPFGERECHPQLSRLALGPKLHECQACPIHVPSVFPFWRLARGTERSVFEGSIPRAGNQDPHQETNADILVTAITRRLSTRTLITVWHVTNVVLVLFTVNSTSMGSV